MKQTKQTILEFSIAFVLTVLGTVMIFGTGCTITQDRALQLINGGN